MESNFKRIICFSIVICFSQFAFAQDSTFVTAHFIYGSKPKAEGERKWFGGKLGGHVGLEIYPGTILHFNPGGKVRAFRRKSPKGVYSTSSLEAFYCTFGCDTVKTMQIRIPISKAYQDTLKILSDSLKNNSPYPYAFFGMRCTAACYHILSYAGVYPKKTENYMLRRFFYPRRLRKFLIKDAKEHNWQVTRSSGNNRRKWDHD